MMVGQPGMMSQQPGMMSSLGGMMGGQQPMSQQLALYNPHQNRPQFLGQGPYGQQVRL